MANRTMWTLQKRRKFLDGLRQTANVRAAVRAVQMSRSSAYQLRGKNTQFWQDWEDAINEATDALEAEAWRRAVEGIEEHVFYHGLPVVDEKGMPVTIRKYSDTLLIFLLKGYRPKKYVGFATPVTDMKKDNTPVFEITLDIGDEDVIIDPDD